MNTLKILSSDNLVIVDDEALQFDIAGLLDDDIWAVSFNGTVGEIEYTDPERANEPLNHLGDYQDIINLHVTQLAAAIAAETELQNTLDQAKAEMAVKMTGFKFRGVDISYTREDRAAVGEASNALEKKTPMGQFYVPDSMPIKISFSNGTRLPLTRAEFDNEFFPAFFAQAVAEFM
jgi:hypothetical protein